MGQGGVTSHKQSTISFHCSSHNCRAVLQNQHRQNCMEHLNTEQGSETEPVLPVTASSPTGHGGHAPPALLALRGSLQRRAAPYFHPRPPMETARLRIAHPVWETETLCSALVCVQQTRGEHEAGKQQAHKRRGAQEATCFHLRLAQPGSEFPPTSVLNRDGVSKRKFQPKQRTSRFDFIKWGQGKHRH